MPYQGCDWTMIYTAQVQGENRMEKIDLTADEKMCLRLWFRQALIKLEQEEAKSYLLKMYPPETDSFHRVFPARKRPSRRLSTTHVKEFAY